MRTLSVRRGRVRLVARTWAGRGPHVVLVHGLASTQHIWDLVVPHLVPAFRVTTYDQRGHGESSKPDRGYGFGEVCADLGAVLGAVGARKPVLVGHSYGANVVLEYAADHPAAGVVCVDGAFGAMAERMDWRAAREMLAPPRLAGMPIDDLLEIGRRGPYADIWSPEVERFGRSLFEVDERGRGRPRLSRANHMRILRALYLQRPVELYRRLACPALILAARPRVRSGPEAGFYEMKKAAARSVRRASPALRWRWITSIHDIPLQRPGLLAREIAAFPGAAGRRPLPR